MRRSIDFRHEKSDGYQEEGTPKGELCQDEAQIVPGGHEQRVDDVTNMPKKEVAVQPAIGLHMPDGGFDGRSSFQLPAHGWRQSAPASGNHHRS